MIAIQSRRDFLKSGGALVVGFALPAPAWAQVVPAAEKALGKPLDVNAVDGFLAINADSSVTLFCGKVDLGQGLRIAIRQMAAEELGCAVERIAMVEGDTALTPDQGPTAGSTGVMRGGVQIRQAAATAREALIGLAAERLGKSRAELEAAGNEVRPKGGGAGVRFGELVGGRRFDLKIDDKAPLKNPAQYTVVGKSLPRPDVPGKVTGRHRFVHDVIVDGMLHGAVIRPPAVGAKLVEVDEASIRAIPGARVVRVNDFLGVVAQYEWDAMSAARMVKARWSGGTALVGDAGVRAWMKRGPFESDETLVKKGDAKAALAGAAKRLTAEYYWPMQSHASMGPSCAIADVREGKATIWTASQATHRFRQTIARLLGMPPASVRAIYLDGAGCYGMNGHEDAAADAAIMSRAVGRPVRVQWMREDEHGWDPKGPPQLIDIASTFDMQGRIGDWRAELFIPRTTRGLPNIPLVGPESAGYQQPMGINTGLISQNADPPYTAGSINVTCHWLKDTPLRPAPIRSPGKPANCFAVESFIDEMAAMVRQDPVAVRLQAMSNPRGKAVLEKMAAMLKWDNRASPGPSTAAAVARGRGVAYIHYKHVEAYVAIGTEVAVERATGRIRVERIVCAHDCGQIINPDGVRAQIEGNILQTLSRVMMEEIKFDRSSVTTLDWASYPIMRFSEIPKLEIELIDRPTEKPVGAGEAACCPVGPSLANAVFDATGVRLRQIPFTPERVKAALAGNMS
jgi:CO/xanthine dehydrogenase Mo-binding subunit